MASQAYSPSERLERSEKYFRVPNELAENQFAFVPAERALALMIFREARNARGFTDFNGTAIISDQQWISCTGLKPRMMEMAARGLQAKGLEITRKSKNKPPSYSWNWNKWHSAFRNRPEPSSYDPKRKERDAAAASKRVHPDCATGCAMLRRAEATQASTNETSPFLVTSIAQPVARQEKQPLEQSFQKTLAAMQAISLSAGLQLLKLLITAISCFGHVADAVLAQAVTVAAQSRGKKMPLSENPALLLKMVPDILTAMKKRGVQVDVGPPDKTDDEIKTARDILAWVERRNHGQLTDEDLDLKALGVDWKEPDIEWAREILKKSLRANDPDPESPPKPVKSANTHKS